MKNLEELARLAIAGDKGAVANLVSELQDDVYALAIRMLWHPQDAEDATQEILIRIVTRLSQFDFKSRLKTWAFRVASNALLDFKKTPFEQQKLNFDAFADDLAHGVVDEGPPAHERSVLTEEVKIGCTLGMLQCLDRPQRLAYVLGEIFEFSAPEAAEALGLEPDAFRKRLQRAREAVEAFTRSHCGLVGSSAVCQCNKRVTTAIRLGRVQPGQPLFAKSPSAFAETRELIARVEKVRQVVELHRNAAPRKSATDFAQLIAQSLG